MTNNNNEEQSRREALRQLILGGLGTTAGLSMLRAKEEECLARQILADPPADEASVKTIATGKPVDGVTGATRTSFEMPQRAKLKEKMLTGKLKNINLSRMFLGGNLVSGFAHARDLIYLSDLVKAYHTQSKVFETFYLAEQCGMNTFMASDGVFSMVMDYWKWTDGKIQFIWQGNSDQPDAIKRIVDHGAVACYLHGEHTDRLVKEENFQEIERRLKLLEKSGLPFGLGAHRIESIKAVVERGLIPEFWVKTYHDTNYWSGQHPTEHDNIFCRRPDETKEFMATRSEPWIAYKVLAAGAIHPAQGFRHAFEGGADFICVGMYDFQMVDNVNLCVDILRSPLARQRSWIGGDLSD